ncbi:ATP-binding protein [Pseudonocardia sp. T1-2H]|uniref:ATP-binding protein n=1 Tax=Pseudonocardia sp. T1-2H TaxID=3128899 RepID=UPI00310174EF
MHELLRQGADPELDADTVRVVRAGEVAALRRSASDIAIVALVRSTSAQEAIAARLAGTDVVLPCPDPDRPDPADLAAARTAARALAGRARVERDETRVAAHEFAGNASAVAMAAQLLGPEEPAHRVDQLRRLASRGAELAWRAGRVARSGGSSVEVLDLAAVVRTICRGERSYGQQLDLRVEADAEALVLIDRLRLARALRQLFDNARRAGAQVVTVHVEKQTEPAGSPGWAAVAITDDGQGLPEGWTSDAALAPFTSGWSPPGDGLGLAEVAEFVADHGGIFSVAPDDRTAGVRAVLRFPGVGALRRASGGNHAAPDSTAVDADWTVGSILEGIARRDPVEESLEALVATMEHYLPGSICSILLLEHDTGTLRHGAGARLPGPYREAIDGVRIGPLVGSCGTAAFTHGEVVVPDIAVDERWVDYRDSALPHGLRSCWSTPILDVDRGIVLGTFAVYHADRWVPGPSATELVQRLTHVAAVAIGTAALHGQLVESEARFRSTFETAGLGIALVSPAGEIQQANAALASMAARPVTGESLADLLVDEDAAAVQDALAAALARNDDAGTLPKAEVRVRRSGRMCEEPLWAALSGSLILGPGGEPRHFCIELFDLTERRRVAQARRERAVAEAADRAKSELLALVSHEVRTPLNAVIGFAQVLQSMQLSPEQQREGVEHILGAGRHLLQLINDLLDLTGAETGQLQLTSEPVRAAEVVDEAMQIVAGLAGERSIKLRTQASSAQDLLVLADRHRLRQVLLNLLGNAIKFTPVGGSVEVVLESDGLLVSDTGDGIATEQLASLFTPFHRANGSGAEGSGLGLALSQRLMRAMGGALTLRSTSTAGSTFRLELPLAASAAQHPASRRAVNPAGQPRGRVVYVEDDRSSQVLVQSALARWPAVDLRIASSCSEARKLLAEDSTDLLLLDIELPDGNGWDLLRELANAAGDPVGEASVGRTEDGAQRRPRGAPQAVVVTAGHRVAPVDLNSVPVLDKPLVLDKLLAAVSRCLGLLPRLG